MKFSEALKKQSNLTRTENGAIAIRSTGNACLDLFGSIGSLREADESRICRLFAEAYKENPLMAAKIAFYGRDVRGGLGERETFRKIIKYMAEYHPEAIRPNLDLIGVYGRYDDMYCLIGTPVEEDMWQAMKKQFEEDLTNLNDKNTVSLLAKWIKTADASSPKTRKLGILTAKKLGYSVYDFKRLVRKLRKHINVTERLMSAGKWDEIKYSQVPSRAMMIYRNAFMKHDKDRYCEFIQSAINGKEKINSFTLYPYDLISSGYLYGCGEDKTIEAQWKQLPNYVEDGVNALVIADTSGSMRGRPIDTALGLAIYFAERNKGAYHNMWMSFSSNPHIHELKGETLYQKLRSIDRTDWGMSTNLKASFELVLEIALENDVPKEDMPKSLIVISDMEIDDCGDGDWTFYDNMKYKFEKYGYEIPNIIFWNVNSRHDVFHADANRKGVQLCSGQSTAIFKQLMQCIGMNPVEMMEKVINAERYEPITIE